MVSISDKTTFTLGVVVLLVAGGIQFGEVRAAKAVATGLSSDVKSLALAATRLETTIEGLDTSFRQAQAEARVIAENGHRVELRVNTLETRLASLDGIPARVEALSGRIVAAENLEARVRALEDRVARVEQILSGTKD